MAHGTGIILLTIGVLLILGLLANYISPRLHIPRVTLLILCGVALGPSGLDFLPEGHERWYTLFSNIALLMIGFVGAAYILLRAAGLIFGAYAGGTISKADDKIKKYMGMAITPQAGVALGMALVAGNHFPALKNTFIPLVIGTTVFFELTGPIFTRLAVIRAGEAGKAEEGETEETG